LRTTSARSIIDLGRFEGGLTMCHDWWLQRRFDEREASRELWDEFEQTRPLSEPALPDEEAEVTLEQRDATPVSTDR
jgi:hypothetical protein